MGAFKVQDGGEGVAAAHLRRHFLAAVVVVQYRRCSRRVCCAVHTHTLRQNHRSFQSLPTFAQYGLDTVDTGLLDLPLREEWHLHEAKRGTVGANQDCLLLDPCTVGT